MNTPSDSGCYSGNSSEYSHLLKENSNFDTHFENLAICRKSFQTNTHILSHTNLYVNRTDFFKLFISKSSNIHLCQKILGYVYPVDLTALDCVCKRTSQLIRTTDYLNDARLNYLYNVKIYKENVEISKTTDSNDQFKTSTPNDPKVQILACSLIESGEKSLIKQPFLELNHRFLPRKIDQRRSPEVSPNKRNWLKYFKLSQSLRSNETLQRCINCSNPAIVLNNVVRCTRRGCMFIYCDHCFNPLCHSVQFFKYYLENNENLEYGKLMAPMIPPPCSKVRTRTTKNENSTATLSDISNSSIFSNISPNSEPNHKDKQKVRRELLFANSIIPNNNAEFEQNFTYTVDNSGEISPADSPPRIEVTDYVIGSKCSKKRLKRL